MQGINNYETFEGQSIRNSVQIKEDKAIFGLPGINEYIPINESLLSKHFLLLGGIGMGKTNVFNHFVRNIRKTMTDNDVMIIFDPKGDYYNNFYQDGDIVISNDEKCNVYWNIFEEVKIDNRIDENVFEVANFLFKDKIRNSSNPFFPNAAKDIFASLMLYIIRKNYVNVQNNKALRDNIDNKIAEDYVRYFSEFADMRGVCSYIGADAKGQSQGVISEFQQTIREIFVGQFKKRGDFSIRKQVRKKGKKVIFIEYDLSLGKTLAPVYALLLDLAIKEALCRKEDEGNVYFILDEFRLVSELEHMDNGINFGRSLGAKFILGMQNVEQVYDVYGEYAGRSILSGCSTLIAYNVVDGNSRQLIKERSGSNIRKITYMSTIQTRGLSEQIITGSTIEDWDISNLDVGEALVQSMNCEPFRFRFKLYQ